MDVWTSTLLLMLRAAPTVPTPRAHRPLSSRIVYDFSAETLAQYMHMRQDEAAKALGIATITLKRICHRRNIRWPYRAYKAHARRLAKKTQTRGKSAIQSDSEARYLVRTDVPALKPLAKYSTRRPTLPSLEDTLGSPVAAFSSTSYPASQRPHLSIEQPLWELAPVCSRLTHTMGTPTIRSPKTEFLTPVLSPTTTRFFPSSNQVRFVRRTI